MPGVLATPTFTKEGLPAQLVRTMVACNITFRTCEHPQFRKFCRFLNGGADLPGRTSLKSWFVKEYQRVTEKNHLFEGLESETKVSIAADCWTSRTQAGFLGIKASYIDAAWQLREPLIAMVPLKGHHTAEMLAKEIETVLVRFNLQHRLLGFCSDSAANMKKCKRNLSKLLADNHGVVWDDEEMGLPCLAHVIELCVEQLLKELKATPSSDDNDTDTSNIAGRLVKDLARLSTIESGLGGTLHKVSCP